MEDLNLTETEMRYFGDLFLCCDEESNGKIPILKATELFRSSNIPNDVLKQIMDLSVSPTNSSSLNHMNRKQFYSALKLIAAHQSNIALKPEILLTPLDLPLPRFTWALNSDANSDLIQLSNSPKEQHISKRERTFVERTLGAYEPIRVSSNLSDSDIPQTLSHDTAEVLSTDSEIESETMSQSGSIGRRGKTGSPWSTASESPTPTNSVAERVHPVWEHSATGRGVWPTNTAEEHTRLLGTEEDSSDRHSSEEDGEGEASGDDVFAISPAQATHYAAQFAQLRPERGLLSGPTARMFFEKSRLSVPDLRKIWQLADITKDGMLTLEEFSIAMHLIILRRNNIPVPDVLPPRLIPKVDSHFSQQSVTTDLVDLGADMFNSGTSADFNFAKPEVNDPYESKPKKVEERQPSLSPKPEPQVNNKEWTKFVDSPTFSVSSPGPKPVNFDFQKSALERDPKIYHPVALRVTPEANTIPHEDLRSSTSPRRDDISHAFELSSPKRNSNDQSNGSEIKSIQRPQPKKPVKIVGVLPPPPARESSVHADDGPQSLQYAPKKVPPPPPPPRPIRNHTRSSSLDLNRFKSAAPPPQPPPRMSPSATTPTRRLVNQKSEEPTFPPDAFTKSDEPNFPPDAFGETYGYEAPKMHGAFEVYRKPSRESSCETDPDVKSLQEQNAVLHRVCRALCAELADVQREREALKVQLDAHSTPV
ncbi:ralBP1-associated Eps domain-containing protein 1 [Pieris rapae]|uniref:ralBP1-associated Eps domain-containing protein 1 n=1 Tax=Pieris rapae TaxID=64459 RepID=UPI001E27E2EA|nr:ralBP1-associated Eps domain-containing protein 1 [Pieris rapae]